ncbi:hypothetical protein [Dysgonomonas macrotermitis]|uniref:Uncharacterized protein n=1 Tax=Dysgonomonas macrotermitis TaxID=1346286 RepID=A0A1M5C4E2_9BACT|nr:hypothetical protein [Dysgonomonas macrotermitis]SHF49609.1 hypothetical protein SAMN05444362_10727 [Dysgonomonas macrotermitis]
MDTIMFIKALNDFSIVTAFKKENKIYINEAYIFSDVSLCINEVYNIISKCDIDYPICRIVYDASIYIEEGFNIRDTTNKNVILYTPKRKFEIRAINTTNCMGNFVFRKSHTEAYGSFIAKLESFNLEDEYNITIDILADVNKYFMSIS